MNLKCFIIFSLLTTSVFSQTKKEVYDYLVSIDCKFPEIVTAQSILETGHFKSYSCRIRHNLFGLRYNNKYFIFDSWQESCDAYISKVQYKYKSGDYYVFLEKLGYASDPDYCKKLKKIKTQITN
tara:strand:+ start:1824 stop:2198 length:375 start_codon:yes stop_codon:yes gene_type:complete